MDDENEGFLVGARATVSDTSDNESLDDDSEYTQSKDETDELHAQGEDETNEPQRHAISPFVSETRTEGKPSSLYDCVKLKSVEIARAAKDWAERYRAEPSEGFVELLTLILKAAGISVVIPSDILTSGSLPALVQSLPKLDPKFFEEEPFKIKKGQKAFRQKYIQLWREITKASIAKALLLDETFVNSLTSALTESSTSRFRSLRYVACLVAGQISIEWLTVLDSKIQSRSRSEQQLRTEQNKRQNEVIVNKIQSLTQTVQTYHEHVVRLESILQRLFDGIFAQRYRDVCEMVRASTTESIGEWCRLVPSLYLDDVHLKFLAWSLCDKASEVRAAAITALVKLYGKDENLMTLREFTVRFRGRICEIVNDVDDTVAAQCTKLLTILVQKEEIPMEDAWHVYKIMRDESPVLRNATADFVSEVLIHQATQKMAWNANSSKEALIFAELIQILANLLGRNARLHFASSKTKTFLQSDPETPTSPFESSESESSMESVDALLAPLFDKLELFKDWKLLLEQLNVAIEQFERDDHRLNIVIQVVTCCIEHAKEEKPRRGRQRKRHRGGSIPQEMTSVFMSHIGNWINEFQADASKVTCFIRMVRSLTLDLFVLQSMTATFAEILVNVMETLFKHHEATVLRECAETLIHSATQGPEELKTIGRDAVNEIGRRLLRDIETEMSNVNAANGLCENEGQWTACVHALERAKFILVVDSDDVFDFSPLRKCISDLIYACEANANLTQRLGVSLSSCGFLIVLYELKQGAENVFLRMPLIKVSMQLLEQDLNAELRHEMEGMLVDLYLLSQQRLSENDSLFDAFWKRIESHLDVCSQNDPSWIQKNLTLVGKLMFYNRNWTKELKTVGLSFVLWIGHPKDSISEFVKSVLRRWRKMNHDVFAEICLMAMMRTFERELNSEDFVKLCQKIATCYVIFNDLKVRSQVHHLVWRGLSMALEVEKPKVKFVTEGLACFTSKLSSKSCKELKEKLKTFRHRIDDQEWSAIERYMRSLVDKARRLGNAPVEKEASIASKNIDRLPSNQENRPPDHEIDAPDRSDVHTEMQPAIQDPLAMLRCSFDSQGDSESHVFDVEGWNLNLNSMHPTAFGISMENNTNPSDSVQRSSPHAVKMSHAIRIQEDHLLMHADSQRSISEAHSNASSQS